MANIACATFVIGAEAANSVRQQLNDTTAYLKARAQGAPGESLDQIARRFDQSLSDSRDGFDTVVQLPTSGPLRVIWRPCNGTAGILYVVRDDELQTISLVLSGVNPKADVAAIEEVGRALSPLDAYYESLAVVRFSVRPILATFCSRSGLNRTVDLLQLAFASVFFPRCGVRETTTAEPQSAARHARMR
jgi:hypothetical protein